MGRLLGLITAGFLGLAVFISYVLFAPGILFQRQLALVTDGQPSNRFFVLDAARQTQLVASTTRMAVVGVCKFDLAAGNIVLQAKLPRAYWTLSIYTQSGKQVYGLNDVQAGAAEFNVELSRSKTFLQQLLANAPAEDAAQIENLGWHAESTERYGIAVVWIPLADELMRPAIEGTIKTSRCDLKN